jgi:exodeoxyribonuclease VII small subunit
MSHSLPKTSVPQDKTIESALGRLESIVGDIEKNPPPLETLIERYEEGMNLLKICREKLDAAEKRVEIITRTVGGKEGLTPFEDQ